MFEGDHVTSRLGGVWAEDIYDATVDDDAFARIAGRLAEKLGARSAVIHWSDARDETTEVSYSGYFSEEHMNIYDRHFADDDLWSAAVKQGGRSNRVWNCDELVPPEMYERSRIYNEWIQPMGDDTFYALGAHVRSATATGVLGFHRGRSQRPFEDKDVHIVEGWLHHLKRMVSIRSKLAAAARETASATAGLNAIGYAVFTLSGSGKLLHCNRAGESLLRLGDALIVRNGQLQARDSSSQKALKSALRQATDATAMEAAGLLLRRPKGNVYEASVVSANAGGNRRTIVVISEPGSRSDGLQMRIRSIYGLTPAEAEVAERIAQGASPQTLAEERGVSLSTVQSQLKSIFAKVGCSRQPELAALLSTFSRLHLLND